MTLHRLSSGRLTPVVLLHGWGHGLQTWQRLAPALSDAGHPVYAAVAPGYDNSSHPNQWGFDQCAKAIGSELQSEGLAQVHLVGHSMGVFTAVALERAAHAAVVSHTWLGIVPTPAPPGGNPAIEDLLRRGSASDELVSAIADHWEHGVPPAKRLSPSERQDVRDELQAIPMSVLEESARCCRRGIESGPLPHAPVTLLRDPADCARSDENVADYFSGLPSAEWIAVRGGGHLLHWTHVDTIVAAVQAHEDV